MVGGSDGGVGVMSYSIISGGVLYMLLFIGNKLY